MDRDIRLSAPDLTEEEAVRVLAQYLAWRKDKNPNSKTAKLLFRCYSFVVREYKNKLLVRIVKKQEDVEK